MNFTVYETFNFCFCKSFTTDGRDGCQRIALIWTFVNTFHLHLANLCKYTTRNMFSMCKYTLLFGILCWLSLTAYPHSLTCFSIVYCLYALRKILKCACVRFVVRNKTNMNFLAIVLCQRLLFHCQRTIDRAQLNIYERRCGPFGSQGTNDFCATFRAYWNVEWTRTFDCQHLRAATEAHCVRQSAVSHSTRARQTQDTFTLHFIVSHIFPFGPS